MEDCPVIFYDYLINCFDEIQLNADLPVGDYTWRITDKFDKVYEGQLIDNIISLNAMPAGLFTPYSGSFTLQLFDSENCQPVSFGLAAYPYMFDLYDTVEFHIRGGGIYSYKNNIGC